MLTLEMLKNMMPGEIFASGTTEDNESGIDLTGASSGCLLQWVAVRGGIHDWAIYCALAPESEEWIKKHGDKIHDKATIRRLVPCEDEAFKMYRH